MGDVSKYVDDIAANHTNTQSHESILDTLVRVAIVECARAIAQAQQAWVTGEGTASHGGQWDTCFRHIFSKVLSKPAETSSTCDNFPHEWREKLATIAADKTSPHVSVPRLQLLQLIQDSEELATLRKRTFTMDDQQ